MDQFVKPDPTRAALLTIDVQNDVLDGGTLEVRGTSQALPAIAAVVGAFRARARPIVHVVRLYRPDGSNVDLCRRASVKAGLVAFCPGTPGSQLAAVLYPQPGCKLDSEQLLAGNFQALSPNEHVMYKSRWGAFFETNLVKHLRERKINTVVIAGANFPNCPRSTAYQASERDFRVVLLQDAVSGLYDRGIEEMKAIGVSVARAGEWMEAITKPGGGDVSPESLRELDTNLFQARAAPTLK